jgi:hypothetical protein
MTHPCLLIHYLLFTDPSYSSLTDPLLICLLMNPYDSFHDSLLIQLTYYTPL